MQPMQLVVQEAGVQGVRLHPKNFDLVKIWKNTLQCGQNLWKFRQNV